MKGVIVLLALTILPLIGWTQSSYPVQKIIEGGDTLVIMTKGQADQLNRGLQIQASYIKEIKQRYDRLKVNHYNLLQVYEDCKVELLRTNRYNDSLLNRLGTDMALLYKVNDSSEVFYVDLKYYTVDVFAKGTIFLTSMSDSERGKANIFLASHPDWKYINVANEFNAEYRSFIDFVRLYPSRYQTRSNQELYLRR